MYYIIITLSSHSLSLCLPESLSLNLFHNIFLFLSFAVSFSLMPLYNASCLSLSLYVSLSLSLSLSLSPSFSPSLSLSLFPSFHLLS